MSKPLSAVLAVMDCLYNGESCLFTKANGFSIFRIEHPQLHFGQCQTIIFDATAQVDHDYRNLECVLFLKGLPKCSERIVRFHLYTHRDMNVSKLSPEEFPDYGTLRSCRVADYTPEWRLREEQAQTKETPALPKSKSEPKPKQESPDPMDEPNPTRDLEYRFDAADNSLGMVELEPTSVLGGDDEDEELLPGR